MRRSILAALLLAVVGIGATPGASGPPGITGSRSSGGKAPNLPSNVSNDQASAGGVAPNPYSTLVLDEKIFFLASRGGVADTDGSMWDSDGNGSFVRNAVGDWINPQTTTPLSIAAAGGTKYNRQTTVANAADTWFCGDSSTFAPCSVNGAGTCTESLSLGDEAGVFCCDATSLCEPVAIGDYNGCNSASEVMGFSTPPYCETAGTFQKALPDGIHGGELYNRMTVQAQMLWPIEMMKVPAVNGINNGGTLADCSGWIRTSDGDVPSTTGPATRPSGYGNGFSGISCSFTPGSAGQKIATGVQNVVGGQWYFARGPARLNDIASDTLTVQAVNAGTPWAAITGMQILYMVKGANLVPLAGQTTVRSRECYGSCYFLLLYQPASSGQVRIASSGATSTSTIHMGKWIGGEAEGQGYGTPLQPASTLAATRFEGDSRTVGTTGIAAIFDALVAAGGIRPGLRTEYTAASASYSSNGRRIEFMTCNAASPDPALCTVPTGDDQYYENYRSVTSALRSTLTAIKLGVNDVSQGATAATIAARVQAATKRVRASGSRPLWHTEPPYRADTTWNICGSGGATNCGALIEDLNNRVQFTNPEALHQ